MLNLIQDQCKQSPPTLSGDVLDLVTRQPRASKRDELTNKANYKKDASEYLTSTKQGSQVNNVVTFLEITPTT